MSTTKDINLYAKIFSRKTEDINSYANIFSRKTEDINSYANLFIRKLRYLNSYGSTYFRKITELNKLNSSIFIRKTTDITPFQSSVIDPKTNIILGYLLARHSRYLNSYGSCSTPKTEDVYLHSSIFSKNTVSKGLLQASVVDPYSTLLFGKVFARNTANLNLSSSCSVLKTENVSLYGNIFSKKTLSKSPLQASVIGSYSALIFGSVFARITANLSLYSSYSVPKTENASLYSSIFSRKTHDLVLNSNIFSRTTISKHLVPSLVIDPKTVLLFGKVLGKKSKAFSLHGSTSIIKNNDVNLYSNTSAPTTYDINYNAKIVRVLENSITNAYVSLPPVIATNLANLEVGIPNGYVFYNVQAPDNTLKVLNASLADPAGNTWLTISPTAMHLTEDKIVKVKVTLPKTIVSSYNTLSVAVHTLAGNQTVQQKVTLNTLYDIFPTSVSIEHGLQLPKISTIFPISLTVYSKQSVIFPVGPLAINPFTTTITNSLMSLLSNAKIHTLTLNALVSYTGPLQLSLLGYTSNLTNTITVLKGALSKLSETYSTEYKSSVIKVLSDTLEINSLITDKKSIALQSVNSSIIKAENTFFNIKGYIFPRKIPFMRLSIHTLGASITSIPTTTNNLYGRIKDIPGTRTLLQTLFSFIRAKKVIKEIFFTVLTNNTDIDYTIETYKGSKEYKFTLGAKTETWIANTLSAPSIPEGVTIKHVYEGEDISDPDIVSLIHISQLYIIPFKVVLLD